MYWKNVEIFHLDHKRKTSSRLKKNNRFLKMSIDSLVIKLIAYKYYMEFLNSKIMNRICKIVFINKKCKIFVSQF